MNPLLECYGTDQLLAAPETFEWRDWSLELTGGDVKEVRFQGNEIIRSIGYILRDENWGTHELALMDIEIDRDATGVAIKIINTCQLGESQRVMLTRILHLGNEGLSIQAELQGNCQFSTARCGFTVLYPLQGVVGSPVSVRHSDGRIENGAFPVLIEPWQPFKDIQRLTYQHAAGIEVATEYAGDIFEMEDQRAWMDGSYKVYSRPLEKPWPYLVDATQPQNQSIRLAASPCRNPAIASDTPIAMPSTMQMPTLGILLTPEMLLKPGAVIASLQRLDPGYLIYHCDPRSNGYSSLQPLANILAQSAARPLHFEYVLPIDKTEDFSGHLRQLADQLHRVSLQPDCIIISPSTDLKSTPPGSVWPWCPPLEAIFTEARKIFPGMTLGGGMISYFTELNRKRPPVALLDFVTHATSPIVHDAADRAVMQTLESLPYITRSTREIIGGEKTYHLGPSMISMRGNPYGADVYENPGNIRMTMTRSDPRQRGRFFASWLVGYLSQLRGAEITHWCPAGLFGSLGLGDILAGTVTEYPAWRLVQFLAAQQGKSVTLERLDNPNIVQLVFAGEPSYHLFANLGAAEQRIHAMPSQWIEDFSLGEVAAANESMALSAFSVVCLRELSPQGKNP